MCGYFSVVITILFISINIEDTLQVRRPSHGHPTLNRRWRLIGYPGLVTLALLCRSAQRPVPAVQRKHPVETDEIDSGPGDQSDQPGNEIQRLEDDMRGAVPIRGLDRWTLPPGVSDGCFSDTAGRLM